MLKAVLSLIILFQEVTIAISAPQADAVLRGPVEIRGSMDVEDFASAELSFTFAEGASDPGAAWFAIQTFSQPPADSLLALWDTTAVTDGAYALRLRVYRTDGSFQDALVPNLTIRNYTPDPTATPTQTPTPEPTLPSFSQFNATFSAPIPASTGEAASMVRPPTATPLPPNPATLGAESILSAFFRSVLIVLGVFLLASLLLRLRRNA